MTQKEKLQALLHILDELPAKTFRTTIGFDACVDTIVRPVASVDEQGKPAFFHTIGEFGRHLIAHEELSCAIDIRTVSEKPGGNMPNLARGLTALGVSVNCVGTLGFPEPDRRFAAIGENLYTAGEPGTCTALQFDDGKVMLSNMSGAESLNYARLESTLGKEKVTELFCASDLVGFVNWAELLCATDLWRDIAETCWFGREAEKSRILLVDLTDCSRHSPKEILSVLALLRECARYRRLIFTLNQNEANQLSAVLRLTGSSDASLRKALRGALCADMIVVHRNDCCFIECEEASIEAGGFFVPHPLISVGAGDTFNAALAFGLLHRFPPAQTADFACLYAALYVETGKAFSLSELADIIRRKLA